MHACSRSTQLAHIEKYLLDCDAQRRDEIKQFLLFLPPAAVPMLIGMLSRQQCEETRAMLREVLATLGPMALKAFTPFLENAQTTLALDLVSMLGQMKSEGVLAHLAKLAHHRDPQVRRAALKAVGGIKNEQADRLLIKALTDMQESVRCQAALTLGGRRSSASISALTNALDDKAFYRKSPTEVRAFFDGLGLSASHTALKTLETLLNRRPLFNRQQADQIRQYAAHALSLVNSPEARAILEAGREAKDSNIRTACRQALQGKTASGGGKST